MVVVHKIPTAFHDDASELHLPSSRKKSKSKAKSKTRDQKTKTPVLACIVRYRTAIHAETQAKSTPAELEKKVENPSRKAKVAIQ